MVRTNQRVHLGESKVWLTHFFTGIALKERSVVQLGIRFSITNNKLILFIIWKASPHVKKPYPRQPSSTWGLACWLGLKGETSGLGSRAACLARASK